MSRDIIPPDSQRRAFVKLALGSGIAVSSMAAVAQQTSDSESSSKAEFRPTVRRALVISNGDYLANKSLPPARKNLVDMTAALQGVGFDVEVHLDLDAGEFKETVAAYARKLKADRIELARGDTVLVFYFFGHGLEFDGINYLIPARSDPATEGALDSAVRLQQDILAAFPTGYPGAMLVFIDASRIGFNTTDAKGLTQLRPPPGSVIMFGTRAGRPAISPKSETRNSFFTGALTASLREYNGSGSLYDLCKSAEIRCVQTVTEEFTRLGVKLAPQQPEIAANLRGNFRLPAAKDVLPAAMNSVDEEKAWDDIQRTIRPNILARQCEAFLEAYPVSRFLQPVKARLQGAREVLKAMATVPVNFNALDDTAGDATYREDLTKALQGDSDAALQIADAYRDGRLGLPKNDKRYELWLRFSAALGSGIAAWHLYELARDGKLTGTGSGSAYWRTRARELGYETPLQGFPAR